MILAIKEAPFDYTERLADIVRSQIEFAYKHPKTRDFCAFFNGWLRWAKIELTEEELLFAEDSVVYCLSKPILHIDIEYNLNLLADARKYLYKNADLLGW